MWEVNLRALWARAWLRIFAANRDPSWLIFEVLLPLLGVFAYVYIYRALQAPPEFIGFAIIGGAMTAYWMNTLWSMAAQFYWEKNDGNLQVYFLAPIHPGAILAGMALGGSFAATLRAGSMLLVGSLVFRVSYAQGALLPAVLIFVLTLIALYGMGACFAALYLVYGREAWHINNLLTEPIYLLSGFYFPIKALGPVIALIASAMPMTLGMDAVRQLIFGRHLGFLPVWIEATVLAGLAIFFFGASAAALKWMEYLARREGRLTLKWQ